MHGQQEDPKTILLIEDEALVAVVEKETLKRHGFNVILASSGEKAIEVVNTTPNIDLILMDIDLGTGKMDGTECAEIILKERDIPILFLLSYTQPDIVEKTERITSYGYVVKDSGETVLNASIKMAFKLHTAHRELKKGEEVLKEREKLTTLFDNAPFGMILTDKEGRFTHINAKFTELFGYDLSDIPDGRTWFRKAYPDAEYRHMLISSWKNDYSGAGPGEQGPRTLTVTCKNGSHKIVNFIPVALAYGDNLMACENITERRLAEEALKNYQQRLASILDSMDALVYVSDLDSYEILFLNKYGRDLWGNIAGQKCWEMIQKDQKKPCEFCTNDRLVSPSGTPTGVYRWEFQNTRNGRWYDCRDQVIPWMDGRPVRAEIATDITERKVMEKTLRESEESYRILFEGINDAVFVHDLDEQGLPGRFLEVNDVACRRLGYAKEELLALTPRDITLPEEYERIAGYRVDLTSRGDILAETIHVTKGGQRIPVESNIRQFQYSGKQAALSISRDITSRKEAEERLEQSRDLLGKVGRMAKVGGWEVDAKTLGLTWTEEAGRIYELSPGYIPSLEEGINYFHPDDRTKLKEALGHALENGEPYDIEIRLITAKGNQIWTRAICHPQRVDGKTVKLLGTFQDITERKLADDRIRSLLSEKELLLKEVHHRIKNNMNVLMGLLSLQSDTLKDPSAVSALQDSRNRVQSMMILYDKLYRSNDFRAISAKEYITALISEVMANFPNRESVDVKTRVDDIVLDAKILSPVGIIINELLTNAMKHAFADRDTGRMAVSFSIKGDHATLIAEDNGIGIPESVNIETSTGFGLQLVNILAEQLEGVYPDRTGEWNEVRCGVPDMTGGTLPCPSGAISEAV